MVTAWNDGQSAMQIGRRMGISRSAVIGKVWRLKNSSDLIRRDPQPSVRKITIPRPCAKSRANHVSSADRMATIRQARPSVVINGKTVLLTPSWNADQNREVIILWNSGKTAPTIASMTGRSVKAIESKVRKMIDAGLCKTAAQRPRNGFFIAGYSRGTEEHKAELRTEGSTVLKRMEANQRGGGFLIEELSRGQCRWPTGGTAPQWRFCGDPTTDPRSSYCAGCRPRLFSPSTSLEQQAKAAA